MTWTEIIGADLPPAFRALKEAARQIGSLQVQNRASLAGNLCNASPAADGAPPLLALEAEVELASTRGVRRMPLEQFLIGYRKTALRTDEILAAVIVPMPERRDDVRLRQARCAKISRHLDCDGGRARSPRRLGQDSASEASPSVRRPSGPCASGGWSATLQVWRRGRAPSSILRAEHFEGLSPIDDIRAGAHYRFERGASSCCHGARPSGGGLTIGRHRIRAQRKARRSRRATCRRA